MYPETTLGTQGIVMPKFVRWLLFLVSLFVITTLTLVFMLTVTLNSYFPEYPLTPDEIFGLLFLMYVLSFLLHISGYGVKKLVARMRITK